MPRQAHPALESLDVRTRMVMRQLAGRGIRNQRVLAAMRWVPREWFLPPHLAADAYNDAPLPIGNGQTISQPYVVALMTHELQPHRSDRILEIGTGSGYQTVVLAHLVPSGKIFTVERLPDLLVEAEERFRRLGLPNIETQLGDGAKGWAEAAPFNGIIVAAAAPRVPEPLVAQLAPGGRLIIPIGDLTSQELVILERPMNGGPVRQRAAGGVRFVPLISRLAFTEER
jgi:protein-L-isoaspartate(D-aspartate) O-methyltransferase